MKYWLIYFLCVAVITGGVPIAADRLLEKESVPSLSVLCGGEICEMSAEEFALRVLLAEGQDCEGLQAKKALAVAARSCGVYLSLFGCKHDGFDLCDDGNCCFYLGDPMKAQERFLAECVSAVEETKGICLTYDDLPAMALFSKCHGSGSRDCPDFTYLTAVSEEELCQEHKREFTADYTALCEKTGCAKEEIISNSALVYEVNRKCRFAIIGGKYLSAEEISDVLGTKGLEFALTFEENRINGESFGVGSGFGLSVCGCERLGQEGFDFEKILEYYYPKLTLNKIYQN